MIYDCFPFFNELDILEIRLNTLNNSVDRFVLVESILTHQGKPKPLHYENNKDRYAKFHHKIIHVISDSFPEAIQTSWDFERYQRNEIKRGLINCNPDDVIIVSDLDEIPKPTNLVHASKITGIKIFQQKTYFNFLNCTASTINAKKRFWNGPVMISFKKFTTAQALRNLVIRSMKLNHTSVVKRIAHTLSFTISNFFSGQKVTIIKDGGWHFSYMGGPQKIIEKLEAFAHTEFNKDELKDESRIIARINAGKSVFGGEPFEFVLIDETFPKYIVDNQERYKHLIKDFS